MQVLLTSEARFERAPDGAVWGPPAYGRALWARYLEVFSTVSIAARVAVVSEVAPGSVPASMVGVQFCPLPAYGGLSGFLRNLASLRERIGEAVQLSPAIIVRTPSPLAYLAGRAAADAGRPFSVEMVGDAHQVFSPGAFRHPLRAPIRYISSAAQRQLARDASAVLYVTREVLQRRYPTGGQSYAASDAALDDLAFACQGRRNWNPPAPFELVTVGGLDQPYKGTAVVLEALHQLRRRGLGIRLCIVGGGRLLTHFRRMSEALGLSPDVDFLGQQDSAGVRRALDSAQLFVLPSLTEGLPRALLEAMARGLPAIATAVGGVPELLPRECLVPPGDAGALAARIEQMMCDHLARHRLGERNRNQARAHHERVQAVVRRDFLRAVRDASAAGVAEVRCA